ncbi:MAG: alpha-glucan family phosphorylase [Calditrichia bacterium]
MEYLGSVRVVPQLPAKISRLKDLADNFYFSWHPEVRDLFIDIDKTLWKEINHNPVKFLHEVQQKKLERAASNPEFIERYEAALRGFDKYMNEKNTWFSKNYPDSLSKTIAYFTAEFGFHESMPIYAGGLGVLAGDHLKSASDLGFPIVGISLFYYQTYFTQEIDVHGNQIANYRSLNPLELPLSAALNSKGEPVIIEVPLAHRTVSVKIWEAKVGRVSAYLLDTNIPQNQPADREITSRLYGGDQEMRISQEIVLGMGGVLALEALGIKPSAWHMNEGHSVFLALQRIKMLVEREKLSFDEALEAVSANTIFTTHTPVPAGNDAFPLHIKDKYFQKYWESVGIRRHQFMELGSQIQPEGYEIFNLTILSLNLSRFRNGVSELHGDVSRHLWKTVWPELPAPEVPIQHITNGVHAASWVARKTKAMFQQYLDKDWEDTQDDPVFWDKIDQLPDEVLWETKLAQKRKMLNHIRERLSKQFERNKIASLQMLRVNQLMKPNVLTIGFARRFATYKRATLIFRDLDRLRRLVNDPHRPVQLIFSGKAHPKDGGGQNLIKEIHNLSMLPEFRGKVVFVENYDMGLARDLVSGVDVWLNNPRRTQEASGTSGQKVGMNGGINFSILDGWWCEGYRGNNGWAFGEKEDFDSFEDWDEWDGAELYDILENDIIPLYYDQNEKNIPVKWIQVMKNSLKSTICKFNTQRMVKEYLQDIYLDAIKLGEDYRKDNFAIAKDVARWREKIEHSWFDTAVSPFNTKKTANDSININFGESWQVEAVASLGKLQPEDVRVQIYMSSNNNFGNSEPSFEIYDMEFVEKKENGKFVYKAAIAPSDSGNFFYSLRILPHHPHLVNPVELGLVKWYQH